MVLFSRGFRSRRVIATLDVDTGGRKEGGLLGIALDPAFRRNGLVYLYRTATNDENRNVQGTSRPSGATFVHRRGSAWTGSFVFGTLRGEELVRLRVAGARVLGAQRLYEDRFGRIRNFIEGPDGALYLLTSNRDGRGDPSRADDRIIRLVPPRR
ncbi:MAG TPA: PQQ-dependent sugar dehydrogenase [Gaiellaceae bacterium]|nr:PQQ-dependent sugar dehydrogenase [Gaiellaceae bacterium]